MAAVLTKQKDFIGRLAVMEGACIVQSSLAPAEGSSVSH